MPLEPGLPAPEFKLPGGDGAPHSLGELTAAGPAVLVFFKGSCPTCQLAFPVYAEMERRYGDAVPVVAVSQDPMAKARPWLEGKGFSGLALDDTLSSYAVSRAYGIEAVPTAVLVDAGGKVERVVQSWDRDEVNELAGHLGRVTGRSTAPVSTAGDGRPVFKPG